MRIVHLAAEFAPFAKAGGLGEVITGLGRETSLSGHSVEVIIPKYDFIDTSKLKNFKMQVPNFKCIGFSNAMWSANAEGCQLHLLDTRHPAGFFHRGKIYGCEDDIARFTFFSRAALEYLKLEKGPIDILHLHDWHVSLCAPLVKNLFKELKVGKIFLSIHNIEYQGKCATYDLDLVGMRGLDYLTPERLQDNNLEFPQTINLLKGGIVYADAIVPVSSSYAKEILKPKYGFKLDSTLRMVEEKITGILNGIDTTLWNPATDKALRATYTIESVGKGKEINRGHFKLDLKKRPWIGAVTRLVPQKGPELLEAALKKTIELGGSFLLLGSSPIPKLQAHFDQLKEKYRGHVQVFLEYDYNEPLAHLIYAALDLLIVPSHFEPCGLTQLIAMRYGTVPIVHATGGLKDTVFDCEDSKVTVERRNGFCFRCATENSMNETIGRAVEQFRSEYATFLCLMRKGMTTDFSWKNPTQEYIKLYSKSLLDVNPVSVDVIADRNRCIKGGDRNEKQANLLKEG